MEAPAPCGSTPGDASSGITAPGRPSQEVGRHPRAQVVAISIVLSVLYLGFLGWRSLWLPDEGRYAELAREMLATGDYLTPRLSGVRFFEKPPLVYWASAASMRLLGPTEWAVRLPCALAGLLALVIMAWLGRRVASRRVGLLTALILGTAPLHYGLSQFLVLDAALTLMVTAALASTLACWRQLDGGWGPEMAALALALGTLVKGPVAIVLYVLTVGPWLVLEGVPVWLTARRVGRCTAIYLALALPWFVAIIASHPEFAHFFLVREHLDRYLTDTYRHAGPVWYFIPVMVAGMFPWTPLIPAALAIGGSRRRAVMRMAAAWTLMPVLFFSASGSKLPPYVAPALPGLALWIALGLDAIIEDTGARARRRGAVMVASVSLAIGAAAVATALADAPPDCPDLAGARPFLVLILVAMSALAAVATWLMVKGRPRGAIATLGAVAMALLVVLQIGAKGLEPHKDLRTMCDVLRRIRRPGEPITVIGTIQSASPVPFYLGEPIHLADFVVSELSFAQEGLEPAERPIFVDYAAMREMMAAQDRRHWFIAPTPLYLRLARLPGLAIISVARGAGSVLFVNRTATPVQARRRPAPPATATTVPAGRLAALVRSD